LNARADAEDAKPNAATTVASSRFDLSIKATIRILLAKIYDAFAATMR